MRNASTRSPKTMKDNFLSNNFLCNVRAFYITYTIIHPHTSGISHRPNSAPANMIITRINVDRIDAKHLLCSDPIFTSASDEIHQCNDTTPDSVCRRIRADPRIHACKHPFHSLSFHKAGRHSTAIHVTSHGCFARSFDSPTSVTHHGWRPRPRKQLPKSIVLALNVTGSSATLSVHVLVGSIGDRRLTLILLEHSDKRRQYWLVADAD